MSQFFDIDKCQDYIETLSNRHKDVNHNVDGIKAFARNHSDSEMTDLKNFPGKNVVVIHTISGHRVGDRDDKAVQREMWIRFASYADNSTEDEIKAAQKRAEAIMFDFIGEMERKQEADLDADEDCGIMHYLRPEEFHWEEIEDEPWLLNHYGYDLLVPFRMNMPAFDQSKWRAEM